MAPDTISRKVLDTVVPEDVKKYLGMKREEFTVGYYVQQLLDVQGEIARTLDGKNREGVLLEARFGTKARDLMPAAKGIKFVPVTDEETALFKDRADSRKAAASMGVDASLELWHTPGNGGDAFSGPHGRMPPSAKLDMEHLPMMASVFGFTGVAFHTWLDVHPNDMRNLSLNLLVRGKKINSAFHGAFHGPIFGRGAASSEFGEVRHLGGFLKDEGMLYSTLGWDPATALEQQLVRQIGQPKVDELREKNVVVEALQAARAGVGITLGEALTTGLTGAGVDNAAKVVDNTLKTVVDKPGCAEVCDWDGTDGQTVMESHAKDARLLGLGKGKVGLAGFLNGEVALDEGRKVTRMELLAEEKAGRILMTGGKIKIKIEPKFQDPSEMTESDVDAVLELKRRVEDKIKDYLGADILSKTPSISKVAYEKELAERFKPYDGCITTQIEEGHSRQMPMRTASRDVEKAIHGDALAGAYHMNWSPSGAGLGDPDHTAMVTEDMVRLMYVLAKDNRIGPDADPAKKVTMEFDMAPHFWDAVEGWQASRQAVNTGVGIALNLIRVEQDMKATGDLTTEQKTIQKCVGTLRPEEGVFDMLDTGRISMALSMAFSMPRIGTDHIPAHEDAQVFRKFVGRPYDIALPTADLEARPEVAAKLQALK
jgi:hypothetical protein